MSALREVMERFEGFRRGGALRHEGGERALRGFLMTGFFVRALGWPWHRLVLGESFDLLAVDWRDQPVFYVETKTPDAPLVPRHRTEMEGRLHRWGSFRFSVLTNGWHWERFDDVAARPLTLTTSLRAEHPVAPDDFLGPLFARQYLPDLP